MKIIEERDNQRKNKLITSHIISKTIELISNQNPCSARSSAI